MNRNLVIAALLLIIISCFPNLSAQEKLTPEEMFRWFPEAKFKTISFRDYETARTMPGFEKYMNFSGFSYSRLSGLFPVPEKIQAQWLSVAEMRSVKMVVSAEKGGDQNVYGGNGLALAASIGDSLYKVTSVGYRMQCIRFPLDLDLHKVFLSLAGVARTEHSFYDLPVYYNEVSNARRGNPSYFFFISSKNELIACENLDYLEKMADTGHGSHPCISEDFPFPYFWEIIPDLGPNWQMSHHVSTYRALVMKLEKDGVDNDIIDGQRKFITSANLNISTTEYSKDPVEKTIYLLPSEELAAKSHQHWLKLWHKDSPRIHRDELGTYKHLQTTLKLDGNMVIQSKVISEEYMKKTIELREKRRKEREKEIYHQDSTGKKQD